MGLFRKREQDPAVRKARAGFDAVAVEIDAAQRALLAAIPTARDPGIPLAQAIASFDETLERARAAMPAWRDDAVEGDWLRCAEAIDQARVESERLRLEPGTLGFERLNERIGDVLAPLDTFVEVERGLRRR